MSDRSAQPAPPSREQMLCRARSLAAGLVRVLETLEAILPLDDAARLELADTIDEIQREWQQRIRAGVPFDAAAAYYERRIERNDGPARGGR